MIMDYQIATNTTSDDEKIERTDLDNLSPVMRKPPSSPSSHSISSSSAEMSRSQNGVGGQDNEHLITFLNGVEADPYLDAFYAVLSQVLDTPYQKTFFNVLQHLREIHLLRHPSGHEYVWDILEKFVCRLKLLRSPTEAQELLLRLTYDDERHGVDNNGIMLMAAMSSASMSECCCSCHRDPTTSNRVTNNGHDQSSAGGDGESTTAMMTATRPPSPPPLPPPPPQTPSLDRKWSTIQTGPAAPPPPPLLDSSLLSSPSSSSSSSAPTRRPTFAEMISNAAASSSTSLKSNEPSTMIRRTNDQPTRSIPDPPPPASQQQQQVSPVLAPPPPPAVSSAVDDSVVIGAKLLSQQNLPQPKTKLKTFAWSKVPASKIVENVNNKDNVWLKAASRFDTGDIIKAINFEDLESLFAAQTSSPQNTIDRSRGDHGPATPHHGNGAANRASGEFGNALTPDGSGTGTLGRRRDAPSDVNLLDPKRSLNVNIFLKQFRGGIEDLIELIATGDSHYLGLEKLRGLIKILPEPEELESLKVYTGDKCKLGNAERFFLALINVSNYRLRVESMLLKEEFLSMVDYMKPSVNTLIAAARDLKNSQSLQEVLFLLLLVGNYLNAGGYGGNAAGFKMTSLWKLVEIRANKPNVTLLHYVVAEIEKKNPRLLDLPKELKHLDEASKMAFDNILSDFRHLKEKTDRISKQVALTDAEDEIRNQTEVFFEYAKGELVTIERDIGQVDRLRLELAAFFCEDAHTFKLEECFKIFATFSQRFARAIDENAERKLQEEKAELRRRLREQQKAKKEFTINHRVSFGEADSAKRLSDKYKSLLHTGDVLLPYHDESNNGAADGIKNLVEVLTTGTPSSSSTNNLTSIHENSRRGSVDDPGLESDFSPGPTAWRRSYNCKRRGPPPSIVSSVFTNRERPRGELDGVQTAKPWKQRFEELLVENEQRPMADHSASSVELDALGRSRQQTHHHLQSEFRSPPTASPLGNVDKPVECSPIFAKTFPRRDNTRLASVNDLDQYRSPSVTSVDQDTQQQPRTSAPPIELKRSVWREQRRLRANSLLNEQTVTESAIGASSANDLNELLEILKIENGSNAAARRRQQLSRSKLSESGDETNDSQRATPPSVLSPTPELVTSKTDIDEVVRHCEQVREEIDSIGQPVPVTLMRTSDSDSPVFDEEPEETPSQSTFEECSADFTLSASGMPDNCTTCNLVISCRGDIRDSVSGSHETIDQSVSVEVMAPSAPTSAPLSELLDEGFEEDTSNSTNCSSVVTGVQSPPLLPSSPKMHQTQRPRQQPTAAGRSSSSTRSTLACKATSTTGSQTKFSYQSGTKASSMKATPTSSTTPKITDTRQPVSFRRPPVDPGQVSRTPAVTSATKPKSAPSSTKAEKPPTPVAYPTRRPTAANPPPAKPTVITTKPIPKAPPPPSSTMAPTKGSVARTRIQLVPTNTRASIRQRPPPASNGASSSSSTSGSDTEQQKPILPRHPPFRRRLSAAASGGAKIAPAPPPTRKLSVPSTTKPQAVSSQNAVGNVARASVSSFRPFSMRKTATVSK